jgi:hypothetical protein
MKSDFYVTDIGGFMLQEFNREIKNLELDEVLIKEIKSFKKIIKDV